MIPDIFDYFIIVLGLICFSLFFIWLNFVYIRDSNNAYVLISYVTGIITFIILICIYINTHVTIFIGLILFLLWFNIINGESDNSIHRNFIYNLWR